MLPDNIRKLCRSVVETAIANDPTLIQDAEAVCEKITEAFTLKYQPVLKLFFRMRA